MVQTVLAAVLSLGLGLMLFLVIGSIGGIPREGVGLIAGSIPPVVWVLATVFLWRETAQEQATRLCRQPGQSILCPACGQDLRGLTGTTCSECGITYTLQQLLHSQPTQADLDEPSGDGSENAA